MFCLHSFIPYSYITNSKITFEPKIILLFIVFSKILIFPCNISVLHFIPIFPMKSFFFFFLGQVSLFSKFQQILPSVVFAIFVL